jgi:hypothetical protein
LTPVHIAILGLATWSLVLGTFGLDPAMVDRVSSPTPASGGGRVHPRCRGVVRDVVDEPDRGAITSGHLPASIADLGLPTSPVFTLDLAFALPLMTLTGIWLLRRDRRGPASAVAVLAFLAILGLSVLAIFAFEAAAGIAPQIVPIVIFWLVTALAALLLGLALTSPGHRLVPASRPASAL